MTHHFIKHVQEQFALVTLQGLDDEAIVMTEEEETTTGAGTFARLEYFVTILIHIEGLVNVR